jgi:hypothetical protein
MRSLVRELLEFYVQDKSGLQKIPSHNFIFGINFLIMFGFEHYRISFFFISKNSLKRSKGHNPSTQELYKSAPKQRK